MTIKIKNWDRFQHYKHRNPPWIRLYRALLTDPEWFELQNSDASWMLASCWLLASEQDGSLPDIEQIAFRFRMSEDQVKSRLLELQHWLIIDDASTLLAPRKHDASDVLPQSKKEKKESKEDKKALLSHFDEFWQAYPKREGTNSKKAAGLRFAAAVKAGADPAAIIAGARAYATAPTTEVGSRFVQQAETWLNKRGWEQYSEQLDEEARLREMWNRSSGGHNGKATVRNDTELGNGRTDLDKELRPESGVLRSKNKEVGR